jgi:hypothetical protein
MSDFIVRFEGLELSKEHQGRLQSAIQKTVLAELSSSALAGATPNPDDPDTPGVIAFLPPRWRGIIVLPADVLRDNPKILQTDLAVQARNVR